MFEQYGWAGDQHAVYVSTAATEAVKNNGTATDKRLIMIDAKRPRESATYVPAGLNQTLPAAGKLLVPVVNFP